jgi:hypothetical protein
VTYLYIKKIKINKKYNYLHTIQTHNFVLPVALQPARCQRCDRVMPHRRRRHLILLLPKAPKHHLLRISRCLHPFGETPRPHHQSLFPTSSLASLLFSCTKRSSAHRPREQVHARSAWARTPRCSPGSPRSTSPSATSAPRETQWSGRPGRRGLSPETCSSGPTRPAGCGKMFSSRTTRC